MQSYIVSNILAKSENVQNFGLAVPVDHRVKSKECEKRDKYLDVAKELKNKKVTIIPIAEQESDDYTN